MSYHQYWHLNELPFGRGGCGNDFFAGSSQREAIARMQFLVGNARACGLLIGASGTGRSTLLKHLDRYLVWKNIVETIRIDGRSDEKEELYCELANKLGASGNQSAIDSWRYICDYLDSATRQELQTLFLVDDASPVVAEVIAAVINRSSLATGLLVTDHDLAPKLANSLGGCPLRIDLPAWTLEDSAIYVRSSISAVGGHAQIFSDSAIVRLHELSDGHVAALARLAELSLLAGAGAGVGQVTGELVEAIQDETMLVA